MKEIYIFLTLLFAVLSCSFTYGQPPGTVKVSVANETFFVDRDAVSNFSWQEYLIYLKNRYGRSSAEYQAALPDYAIWEKSYPGNGFFPLKGKNTLTNLL